MYNYKYFIYYCIYNYVYNIYIIIHIYVVYIIIYKKNIQYIVSNPHKCKLLLLLFNEF